MLAWGCGGETTTPPGGMPDAGPSGPGVDATGTEADSAVDVAPPLPRIPKEGPPPVTEGLIAYFPLDDATGAVSAPAAELIGGLPAAYVGATAGPTRSDPGPVHFTNSGGAHFTASDVQAVRVPNAPERLKVPDTVSISLWLRTTAAGNQDLVSLGDSYGVRAGASVDMIARGDGTWVICPGDIPVKDGLWHHGAVVKDGKSIRVYVDGRLASLPCENVPQLQYDQGMDLWIGQHGNGSPLYQYDGDLDDVRIYGRALTPDEILRLAGGA